MVKILHTSDWHLGASLAGYPREIEHRAALAQIVEIARERAVDAVVVAGDIFDSLNPSADAQRLLYETLRDLRAARPQAAIALVAGNHDPAGRLEALRALFDFAGVSCVGSIGRGPDRAFDAGAHLTPVRDAGGTVRAYLLLVPYPRVADLPLAPSEVDGSPIIWQTRMLYREAIAAARARIGDAPLIVTGHLHVKGGLESEGAEKRIIVGGEHAAPPDIFPGDLAYVALGHLHRRQSVARENLCYAGSLFPMSKTEVDYDHGVNIVTLEAGRVTIDHAPLSRRVPSLRVPGEGTLQPALVGAALAALGLDVEADVALWPFVHLALAVDGPAVNLRAEIDQLVERFPLRLASMSLSRPQMAGGAEMARPVAQLSERRPVDLFIEAFARRHGTRPLDEHLALFATLACEEAELCASSP